MLIKSIFSDTKLNISQENTWYKR